ncbi:gag-pol polyprotein [Nephila pilipes]|uniref:Gag-pol polyprotein n=1 Tax=Nephila pilipes TaxID=299642 RepID=A0A8X6TZZ6_NEPPI|nr:gag-pol polyprotein [Nephila pilipes]
MYGTKRNYHDLSFPMNLQFTWSFMAADVRQPVIEVDFLKIFNLLVDAKHYRVNDANTKLYLNGQLRKINSLASNLAIVVDNTRFDEVLKQYSVLINPSQPKNVDLSNQFYHRIETKGPPVFSKPRRLSSKILKAVQEEFEYLMSQACQRSKVQRPTVSPIQSSASTHERFQRFSVDLVGPLPPSDGFTYLLACINRHSRGAEAIPLSDMSAETVAKSFIATWPEIHVGNTAHPNYFVPPFFDRYGRMAPLLVERLHRSLKPDHRCLITSRGNDSVHLVSFGPDWVYEHESRRTSIEKHSGLLSQPLLFVIDLPHASCTQPSTPGLMSLSLLED